MSVMWIKYFFILLCSYSYLAKCQKASNTELLMVHALFRHGERTTENFYPNDPYKNSTFYPIGLGSLTNKGKMQEYHLGQFLRSRYNDFLGPYHMDNMMEVRSTGFGRTRKSALLVVAGLWPPTGEQIWNEKLLWNPIPVDYKIQEEDDLLNVDKCARRTQILEKQHEIPEVQEKYLDKYKNLISFLKTKSGMDIKSPVNIASLYMILKTEKEATNLTLPKWTSEVYPDALYEASSLTYNYLNYDPEVIKINTGYFLQKVINDCKSKINGNFAKDEKKIMLYSGHESTVGVVVDALNVAPHIPNYSSALIIELHKIISSNTYALKFLYKREVDEQKVEEIILPGCDSLCPLDKFESIMKNVLPTIPFKQACERK